MSELKLFNSPEDLEELKKNLSLDEKGMITILGQRFILTPQETFGNMMFAATDLGGVNMAKVFMRRAGFEAAYKVAETMIERLGLSGEDVIRKYMDSAGKRGWYFGEVEKLDAKNGVFLCRVTHSPFALRFDGKSKAAACDFIAGAFEAMFDAGGFKGMQIIETECIGKGDPQCVFKSREV
jgi:predicted hydrocarbon binding protein